MFELYSSLNVIGRRGRAFLRALPSSPRVSRQFVYFSILLHRARPIKRWRSIVRRLITNNRTFTALNSWSNETCRRAQRCIVVDTDSRLSFMHYILQRISFASITVDRCANCRSRVKRIDSMERDGKYAAPLESSSLTVRSIIEIEQYVTYGSQLRVLCKWMVLISETKGVLKCRTIGGIFLLFTGTVGIYIDSKENWRARQKSIYRYIARETYCLRLHVSRATSFVDSVNSSERVRGIIG